MRRAVAALVVCVALRATAALAAPDACEPSVRVSGDPDVASPIRASLAERGLGDVAAAACPPMEAIVERAGGRLRVEVTDSYGRKSQREVRDTATAIALIESWARPEVVGDELPGALPAIVDAAPLVTTSVAAGGVLAGTGIALIAGADYAGDGTTWARGGVAGCIAAGPVCIGGRLEVAKATALTTPGDHPRRTTSVTATVELPRAFGRLAVVPAVGMGGAWATIGGLGPHMDQTQGVTSLRFVANVAVRLRVARGWAVELDLGGEAEAISGTPAVPGGLGRAGLGVRYGGW